MRPVNPRIAAVEPLLTPAELRATVPVSDLATQTLLSSRHEISRVLDGTDDRLLVVTGPCSVHDADACLTYAERLAHLAEEVSDTLLLVMRVYVEKPRTRLGWKGLVSDPHLNGSHDVNEGLRLSRELLTKVLELGLPTGCEFLDPTVARYLSDLVSWGAIGARTVQSQTHRALTSGLEMPVGMKNTTTGAVGDAIDAIVCASQGHVFPGIDDDGLASVIETSGNPDCHIVLRGGAEGPNYGPLDVARTLDALGGAGLPKRLVIDASHGNSGKDHERQPVVVAEVARRIAAGEGGIAGLMVESFLASGRQDLVLGETEQLTFGQSVTDACVGWDRTTRMVAQLADAVTAGRAANVAA
ncbi:3-deoxy-7-phosphoheptulonate synthase [Herbidospora mongoliensis]|uniref:3-deoxy-7-phosphoheptulonate synthase n=1 Tax=Herbidospora mongoliensis TaxID=688067 RepID=UPI00082B3043|nr:3-deoxy-7-phosphoheptulonate synthase [Herbidospora mongoliensis]